VGGPGGRGERFGFGIHESRSLNMTTAFYEKNFGRMCLVMRHKPGKYQKVKEILKQKACSVNEIAMITYPCQNQKNIGIKRKRKVYAAIAYLREKGIPIGYKNSKYYLLPSNFSNKSHVSG
jgi:hypothetical protein